MSNEAFERYVKIIGYNEDEIFFVRKGYKRAHTHIAEKLNSEEMVEDIAGAIRCVDLGGDYDGHELIKGSQLIAREVLSTIKQKLGV